MALLFNLFQTNAVWVGMGVVLSGLAIALLIRALWEPTALECRTVRIELPAATDKVTGLRVLLLSDLHAEFFRIRPERLLAACTEARPDLVLFAGDLAAKRRGLPTALKLMRQIRELPELADCPFFAVRGNHDSEESTDLLRQTRINVLENQGAVISLQGQPWMIIGLEDLKQGHPDAAEPLRQAAAAGIPPQRRLIMAHNPDTLLGLPTDVAALFVAGHFHGGQIWLPFHLEFVILRREKLPRIGIYKGLFDWQGSPAYISRGLGCVALPLRLFSRPELTVFEISSKK